MGSRILLIAGKEYKMAISVGIGAVINIIGNAILIPKYYEMGAVFASLLSELFVMLVYINFGRRYYQFNKEVFIDIIKILAAVAFMTVLLLFISNISCSSYIRLLCEIFSGIFVYLFVLVIIKESMVTEYFNRILKKLNLK